MFTLNGYEHDLFFEIAWYVLMSSVDQFKAQPQNRAQKQVDEGKTALQVEREAGLLCMVCLKNVDTFGE